MNENATHSREASKPADEAAHSPDVDGLRELLLRKLRQAGTAGVAVNEFGYKTQRSRALLDRALAELMAAEKIVGFHEGRRAICFLPQFAPTVESVRHKVEQIAREAQVTLLSKNDLSSALMPAERMFFTRALVGLLAEKVIIKLSYIGRTKNGGAQKEMDFYMHTSGLRELIAATYPEAGPPPFTPLKLLEGYRRLVQRNGFPDVEIFELHESLGLPLPEIRAQILAEYEAGRAVLSFGDWSLASPETRSGAIEINGDRYLRVRFQDEQHVDE
jgi:hypothetical protein